jgi:hypothetical protein
VRTRADNGHIAIEIGAPNRHAEPRHLTQEHGRRVAIIVVQPNTDDAHAGLHGG